MIELHSGSLPVARAALRSLRDTPGWEAVLLRTKPLSTRPGIPVALRGRVRVRTGRTAEARAAVLAEAAIFVPAPTGSLRLRLEAAAAGAALADPPGVLDQPELAAAAARPARSRTMRCASVAAPKAAALRRSRASRQSPRRLDAVYRGIGGRKRARRRGGEPLGGPPLDPRRPAHAHVVVARLLDRGRRAPRPCRGGRARRDRRHRPQRLRRCARGGRARARPRADRDPGRGGEDRRPGRGDRALPRTRRSRAA